MTAICLSALANASAESEGLGATASKPPQPVLGWSSTGKLGVNGSLASASNVVGQTDGSSETYGLDLKGARDFASVASEWKNALSYAGATTKTAAQPRYVKSADLLKLETAYRFNFPEAPRFGPYARASAEAPLFFGEDVRPSPSTYTIQKADGSTRQVVGDTLRLTDGFKPLATKESTGLAYKAVDNDPALHVELRAGAGAEQISADGQFAVTNVAADGSISVKELKSVNQVGLETGIAAYGKMDEKTGWQAGLEALVPFINNKEASDDRDPLRLTNIEGYLKFSSNITAWASFSYSYKLEIKPQLIDRTQQTHLVALNLNYNLF